MSREVILNGLGIKSDWVQILEELAVIIEFARYSIIALFLGSCSKDVEGKSGLSGRKSDHS